MDQQNQPPTNQTPAQPAQVQPMPQAMPVSESAAPTIPPPPTPTMTTPPPAPSQPTTPQKGSSKMIPLLIAIIVLALVGALGWYMIMGRARTTEPTAVTSKQSNYQQSQPSPSVTPSVSEQVESVDIGASDPAELQTIQQDVNGL